MARRYIASAISRNLQKPGSGFFGYMIKKILPKRNRTLELQAVELSRIEPQHTVLEIGFGPGVGIKAAYELIKDGSGSIFGVELSEVMLRETQKKAKEEVASGKIKLVLGSVDSMPFEANTFDRVYHCNCYYFWPDLDLATKEIYRVMKPMSQMVTTLCLESLQEMEKKGFMECGNTDPARYMQALELAGFQNVKMEHMQERDYKFQAIIASLGSKP